jgi:hypothetical protein
MNKSEVGYMLLMIIANIDHHYEVKEKEIINQFLRQFLPPINDIDKLNKLLSTYKEADLLYHFELLSAAFYGLSTYEERKKIIEFALQLVQADEKLTADENKFVSKLFVNWDFN